MSRRVIRSDLVERKKSNSSKTLSRKISKKSSVKSSNRERRVRKEEEIEEIEEIGEIGEKIPEEIDEWAKTNRIKQKIVEKTPSTVFNCNYVMKTLKECGAECPREQCWLHIGKKPYSECRGEMCTVSTMSKYGFCSPCASKYRYQERKEKREERKEKMLREENSKGDVKIVTERGKQRLRDLIRLRTEKRRIDLELRELEAEEND